MTAAPDTPEEPDAPVVQGTNLEILKGGTFLGTPSADAVNVTDEPWAVMPDTNTIIMTHNLTAGLATDRYHGTLRATGDAGSGFDLYRVGILTAETFKVSDFRPCVD